MKSKRPKKSKSERLHASWSQVRIHQNLLKDRSRTLSYKRAIEDNVKDKDVVLDIGCGTGVLSFFAAKKGCRKIYSIDRADIIDDAIKTAKLNDLEKDIKFIKEDILKFKPREKIDILIHEQFGSFVWNENMISKVAYIRDNFLKKNGLIIPYKVDLYLVPSSYKSDLEKSISFWSREKYGINFSNLSVKVFIQNIKKAIGPSVINLRDAKTFLCKEKLIYTINLRKETKIPQKITSSFRLKKNSKLRGMCMYFKVSLDENNVFSTRPKKSNTHWGQIFLPYSGKGMIKRDSFLSFTLFPKKEHEKWKFKFEII